MNRDDESFLSAYLDGELDSSDRPAVESALASDADLSDRLRELAAVRDLVGRLGRPAAPCDLARETVGRIAGRRPGETILPIVRPRSRLRVRAAGLAAAASLLMTLTVGVLSLRQHGSGPVVLGPPKRSVSPVPWRERPELHRSSPRGLAHATPVAPRNSPVRRFADRQTADDIRRASDALKFRAMLDSPNLRKVFVVIDEVGGADQRVKGLLESSPRINAEFGRISICQGIVFDRKHPNAATVFAVAVNDHELDKLRSNLRETFAEAVEENDADPQVVTQLADIGQVSIHPGTAVASLEAADRALQARKTDTRDHEVGDEAPEPPTLTQERKNSGPAPFHDRIAPAPTTASRELLPGPASTRPEVAAKSAASSAIPAAPGSAGERSRDSVVLVWVTTAEARGQGP
jgi:hypothetical protein